METKGTKMQLWLFFLSIMTCFETFSVLMIFSWPDLMSPTNEVFILMTEFAWLVEIILGFWRVPEHSMLITFK